MPSEIKKVVVTVLVMRHFLILRGAPRACVDFCDPTAVSRLNVEKRTQTDFRQVDEQEKDSPKWDSQISYLKFFQIDHTAS